MAIGTPRMETGITTKPKPAPAATPAPANAPSQPIRRTALCCVAAACGSGVLLFLCHFPVALGTYLGWFALAPMLLLVRTQLRPSLIFLLATLGGMAFYVPALSWMRVADRSMILGWFALSLYCALYIPAGIFCVRGLDRWRLPIVVSVPIVWSALEFFRSFFLTGFAWYYLGHTQHDNLAMIQIADIGGVYLVTFVVAAVNALVFDIAYQFPEVRGWFGQAEIEPYRLYASVEILNRSGLADALFRRNLIIEGILVILVLLGTYWYGVKRLGENQFQPGPVVCLLQSNLDQRLREQALQHKDQKEAIQTADQHYTHLCIVAAFNNVQRPDLLIWPETSYPVPFYDIAREFPTEKLNHGDFAIFRDNKIEVQKRLTLLTKDGTKVPHLIGMNAYYLNAEGKPLRYNKAVLVAADGHVETQYDKIHRLPFGEYMPLKDWLPFLQILTPYEGDFGIQAGQKLTRFEAGRHRYGVLICFEDTDPFLARRYVEHGDDGPPVDFLVNMSNDGWFDGSSEHEEHLAISRFRAIECRRSLVRAVNMGVSAVIDGNGVVQKPREIPGPTPPLWAVAQEMNSVPALPISSWSDFKKKPGVVLAAVPIDRRSSFYAAVGDWLPIGCWLALFGSAGWAYWQRRKAVWSAAA